MNLAWIIFGIVILLGVLIFLFLILKERKKHKAIKHYEELRDKLSVREVEEETGITEEDYNSYSGISLSSIIRGFISILVGVSLIGPISEQVAIASEQNGMANSTSILGVELLTLVPGIFAIAILSVAFGIVFTNFRKCGVVRE